MAKDKQPKPETKAQRATRLDSAYQCPVGSCGASFADAATLGLHMASKHTAQTPGLG